MTNESQRLALELADDIRTQPKAHVDLVPRVASGRHVYGTIAVVAAALVVAVLAMPRIDLSPPPAQELAVKGTDRCAQSMDRILHAIDSYLEGHGSAPASLATLDLARLGVTGRCPVSNAPYHYAVDGQSVSLSCPTAHDH